MADSGEAPIPTPAAPNEMEQRLPKLSAADFRVYNHMAEGMEYYHNNFRQTWTLLHNACTSGRRPLGMSLPAFLGTGLSFVHHLSVHHSIEENHIFPHLATKMAAFRSDLEDQHKEIHKGMDELEKYLLGCKSGERELRLEEMKRILDGFGEVLWRHLEDEVKELGADNMRKYWTKEEMRRMPM
ncbi:hypothetical protein K402DRAFT_395040 [Aulographum hederae CBS 113979]|uniref:Hemerythrin-like domain-containing protein n=1 Tax=Aulographum hederae CBS 113979 TaxID=1176131 RepID=A0A6G1GW57_9PEZI|nr:hypothetical protein K402DRAFT_395040 [Aulographum hederae CBS 113979]